MEIVIEQRFEVPDDLIVPRTDLPVEDGVPLESPWHRSAMNLLIDVVLWFLRGRHDFYVGGNMFIHYCEREIRERRFRGPDFFFVKGVDGTRQRLYWYTVEEDGRYPDVIIELLSPTTATVDRTTKKDLYEQTFRTPEYFWYDPATQRLEGWRHDGSCYQVIPFNERGWLWCEELGLWLGTWEGTFQRQPAVWPRFYDPQGQLVPTQAEAAEGRAEAAEGRAEAADERARTAAEALARLKAWLAEQGMAPPANGGSTT